MRMHNTGSMRRRLSAVVGGVALALASWSASANGVALKAYDTNGFTTASDEACAQEAACALGRGGISDVMTIYNPDGSVLSRLYAFGGEEASNLYYLSHPGDLDGNWLDLSQYGHYTTLFDQDGSASDVFGIVYWILPSGELSYVLAFLSDPNQPQQPLPDRSFMKMAGSLNPYPDVDSDGERFLSIAYDATLYLSPQLRDLGYTADFRSDVPEPGSLLLLGAGLLGLGARRCRPVRRGQQRP